MPWLETDPMDQRLRFILDDQRGLYDRTELCDRDGISRKTGYKWLARYEQDGRRGLQRNSRAPHHRPHRIPAHVAQLLCAARTAHPDWGPAKLLDWLRARHPRVAWPAASTVGDLLTREGLVTRRRRRRPHGQRRAVRHASDSRPLGSQRLVDAPGHSAPADSSRLSARERRP